MEIIDLTTPPPSPKPSSAKIPKEVKKMTGRTRVTFTREEREYLGYKFKHPQLLKQGAKGFPSALSKRKWIQQFGPYFHRQVELDKDLAATRTKALNKARQTILKRLKLIK